MKLNENPYKKIYSVKANINVKAIIKLNKELRDMSKEQNSIYNQQNRKAIFRCDKCDISYNNPSSLEKHKPIHLNPVYCPFTNCNKIFSPTHKYQFKQHIDGHNGGLHIKCKFCNHTSKTLTSNTVHMKKEHLQQYTHYMKEIEESNKDTQPLNSKNIINLTTKYINTHIMDDEDEELINIELNKYNFYYYLNNLDLLSTIALLDAYKKI